MVLGIKILGFLFSRLDTSLLEQIVSLLAKLFFVFPSRRKETLISNLRYAFPEWSEPKIDRAARVSVARMIEMGFFSLTYPFMSKSRWRSSVLYSEDTEKKLIELRKSKTPVLFLLPHFALFETLATSPTFRPFGGKKLGAIFRPNRSPKLDSWIDSARKSTGLVTFSRKEGLLKAKNFLKEGNWLVILFDQNAGDRGTLDLFFNRLVSCTTLPDSLARRTGAKPVFIFPQRRKFFVTELRISELPLIDNQTPTQKAHHLLERILKNDPDGCPEWLWSHNKWNVLSRCKERFNIPSRKCNLTSDQTSKIIRNREFYVRMPNWLGDVIMAVPIIQAMRVGRPDAKFTLVCKREFVSLLKLLNLADAFLALPPQNLLYFYNFKKSVNTVPENYYLFTNSLRGDLEAYLSGSSQRFGMIMPGKKRPLLTNIFIPQIHAQIDPSRYHQTAVWEKMANRFGLRENVLKNPILFEGMKRIKCKIGIVAGSSNSPEKRWLSENWIKLIQKLANFRKDLTFNLYGTDQDKAITQSISGSLKSEKVFDHAGRTSLLKLAEELASCSLVIGNDTGSMHLANMVGTPVVVIFGPTNSAKTKPFFDAESISLHSPNPLNIDDLSSKEVFSVIKNKYENIS
jgi:heptosyltransferase-2